MVRLLETVIEKAKRLPEQEQEQLAVRWLRDLGEAVSFEMRDGLVVYTGQLETLAWDKLIDTHRAKRQDALLNHPEL
jgi:hypothetical protein